MSTNEVYWTGREISWFGAIFGLVILLLTGFQLVGMLFGIVRSKRIYKQGSEARRAIESKGAQEGRKAREEYERLHHDEQARLTAGRTDFAAPDGTEAWTLHHCRTDQTDAGPGSQG